MLREAPREVAVSIVVPVFNEEETIPSLVAAVQHAMTAHPAWELILVDDGSTDETAAVAEAHAADDPRVRVLRLARNYGQTQAMQAGFDHARAPIVVSMDGDLQNDPDDIPRLLETMQDGDYDLVAGYRVKRQDTFLTRKVPSWIANRLIAKVTGVRVRDNGCSLKAFRRALLQRMPLYSDMHRFLPALAVANGGRLVEIPVRHHARRFGQSKYGLSRTLKIHADVLTIKMIGSYRERPLAMFGIVAGVAALAGTGFLAASALAITRFSEAKAAAFVLPGCAFLLYALAGYLVLLGLVGQTALQQSRLEDVDPLFAEPAP
jgi:glycosyltransferase involved in cell wall biosynthesis